MAHANLIEFIKMSKSAKNFAQDVRPYSVLPWNEIIALAREHKWKREPWLAALKAKKEGIEINNEATVLLFECTDLRKYFHGELTFAESIYVPCEVHIKVKSGIELQEALNNPYIIAQAANVASYSTFITNMQAKYSKLNKRFISIESNEEREAFLEKALTSLDKKIKKEQVLACERGFLAYQREMNLEKQIKWQRRKRWTSGTLSVVGAIASVAGAAVTTVSVVASFGGTAVGAGIAIHGACTTLMNTTIQLRSMSLAFEKSLMLAEVDFRRMESLCSREKDTVKTTKGHAVQALGQILVGDLAAPYKRAKQHVENADYRIAKIESTLQQMGKEIQNCLNVIDNSARLFKGMIAEIKKIDEESSAVEYKKAIIQLENMQQRIQNLEMQLDIVLIGATMAAQPVENAVAQIVDLKQKVREFAPTKTGKGLVLLITALGAAAKMAATMGASIAENAEWTNAGAEAASTAISHVSTGVALLRPSVEIAHGVHMRKSASKTKQL